MLDDELKRTGDIPNMTQQQRVSPLRQAMSIVALTVIGPYVILYWGFSDPGGLRDEFGISQNELNAVMAVSFVLVVLFTYLLRKVFLALGVLAILAYGVYLVFSALDLAGTNPTTTATRAPTKSKDSLREKCVELTLGAGKMDRPGAVAYCNSYYK
jgi:hypothetical protein